MTTIYYAFIAGFAGGVVIAVGALALLALRTLGEEDLPDDHECTRHLNGGRCSFDGCDDRHAQRVRIPAELTPHQPLVRPTQYQD